MFRRGTVLEQTVPTLTEAPPADYPEDPWGWQHKVRGQPEPSHQYERMVIREGPPWLARSTSSWGPTDNEDAIWHALEYWPLHRAESAL